MSGTLGIHRRSTSDGGEIDSLSPREREVMAGVLSGLTNKQIGTLLGISHRTVEIHRARLMRRLHVTTVAELIARAHGGYPSMNEPKDASDDP